MEFDLPTPNQKNEWCRISYDIGDFIHRAKGAMMYVGGSGNIEQMRLHEFIDCCYKNGIKLGVKVVV